MYVYIYRFKYIYLDTYNTFVSVCVHASVSVCVLEIFRLLLKCEAHGIIPYSSKPNLNHHYVQGGAA